MTELVQPTEQRWWFTGKLEDVTGYAKLSGKLFIDWVFNNCVQHLVDELVITKGQIRGIKRIFSYQAKMPADKWEDDYENFNERVNNHGIQVSKELHEAGVAFFKKGYKRIAQYDLEGWNYEGKELVTRAGTEEIKRFRFKGFVDATTNFTRNHFPERKTLIPVYEVELMDGKKFRYAYSSWQSGMSLMYNPEYYIA